MPTHSEDRQVLMRKDNGTFFQAAVTHKEKKGVHWVVVSAAEQDLSELRNSAPAILALLSREHGVPADAIRYFERGRDGAVFAVDPQNAGTARSAMPAPAQATFAGINQPSGPKLSRRGVWCDEVDLMERIGKVRLPQVDPSLRLTPVALPAPTQANTTSAAVPAHPAQSAQSSQSPSRSQRPRYPRPK